LRCERWGKEPTPRNIRAVMGPSLHLIRFPAMPCCEFNHVVGLYLFFSEYFFKLTFFAVPTHVLTDAQVVQIIVRADGIPFSRVPRKSEILPSYQLSLKMKRKRNKKADGGEKLPR
jgi:hypothetical protein